MFVAFESDVLELTCSGEVLRARVRDVNEERRLQRMVYKDLWADIEESPDLWKAVSAAVAVVAASDGRIREVELTKFREWISSKSKSDEVLKVALADFDALTETLLRDFDEGMALAKKRLEAVKDSKTDSNTVIDAARAAIVADLRIDEREELVMQQLCELLGVDPSAG